MVVDVKWCQFGIQRFWREAMPYLTLVTFTLGLAFSRRQEEPVWSRTRIRLRVRIACRARVRIFVWRPNPNRSPNPNPNRNPNPYPYPNPNPNSNLLTYQVWRWLAVINAFFLLVKEEGHEFYNEGFKKYFSR